MSTGVAKLTAWGTPSNSVSPFGVLTPGIVNVKGAYTELVASTGFACDCVVVIINSPTGVARDWLIDIAVGAALSEVVVVGDLGFSGGSVLNTMDQYILPISIASGSRVAARCQSSNVAGGPTITAQVILLKGLFPLALTRITGYGVTAADSGGISVDPGATINTKGAYSQIIASSTNPIKALIAHWGSANTGRATATWKVDIATGAAASEVVKIADVPLVCDITNDILLPQTTSLIPIAIPAGTRIAVRAQCDINDAADRLLDAIVYGID